MAGLELFFHIACLQDALVCYLHWTLIAHSYRCLSAGEQLGPSVKKSEMLPDGWEANKDLYILHYVSLLLKERLGSFDKVYKNTEELQPQVAHHIISLFGTTKELADMKKEPRHEKNPLTTTPCGSHLGIRTAATGQILWGPLLLVERIGIPLGAEEL